MKNFAVVGVGGYIAPRHIQAINDTGNRVVAAMDVNDSVGILDRYTQDVAFFKDFERFEAHVESLKGTEKEIHYLTICSPNHLHAAHIKAGLRLGCNVICEKPLVLTVSEIEELRKYEEKYNKKVYTVLQLRVHDSIIGLREKIQTSDKKHYSIDLKYITSRGPWYHESWKGNADISGGLTTNIGIHFFDMLIWLFGDVQKSELLESTKLMSRGKLKLERADVDWMLSVDRSYLPESAINQNKTTYRSILIEGEEIEFSGGFTDLHTKVYQDVLDGNGYGIDDAKTSIGIVEKFRDI